MKLLVDMGNSTMKWATISGGVLSQVKTLTYEDISGQLKHNWQSISNPDAVVVSCVAHEQQWQELSQVAKALWKIIPQRIVSPAKGSGVINAYQQPEKLGSDRWAALVAAHAIYDRDICVVDCGTALTIDLLSADGQHLGGVIIPGTELMQNSLHLNTASIKQHAEQLVDASNQEYWGRDTQSGIIAGSWQAQAGAVAQIYGQFTKQSNQTACVLCGGGAEQLAGFLDIDVEFQPDLVLKGLAVIAGENITV